MAVSFRGSDGLETQKGKKHTVNPWLEVFMKLREERKQLSHEAATADPKLTRK